MSIRLQSTVWDLDLAGHLKLMLLALADNADTETGECFPSYASLSRRCTVSRRTAIRQVDQLVELGFVQKEIGQRRNGSQTSNIYVLALPGKGGDKMTPRLGASDTDDTPPGDTRVTPAGDTDDTPITISLTTSTNHQGAPDGVDPQAWSDFCEHRTSSAKLRKGWSAIGQRKAAELLAAHTPEQQRELVDYSIAGGYSGLFPDRLSRHQPQRTPSKGQRAIAALWGDEEWNGKTQALHQDAAHEGHVRPARLLPPG